MSTSVARSPGRPVAVDACPRHSLEAWLSSPTSNRCSSSCWSGEHGSLTSAAAVAGISQPWESKRCRVRAVWPTATDRGAAPRSRRPGGGVRMGAARARPDDRAAGRRCRPAGARAPALARGEPHRGRAPAPDLARRSAPHRAGAARRPAGRELEPSLRARSAGCDRRGLRRVARRPARAAVARSSPRDRLCWWSRPIIRGPGAADAHPARRTGRDRVGQSRARFGNPGDGRPGYRRRRIPLRAPAARARIGGRGAQRGHGRSRSGVAQRAGRGAGSRHGRARRGVDGRTSTWTARCGRCGAPGRDRAGRAADLLLVARRRRRSSKESAKRR